MATNDTQTAAATLEKLLASAEKLPKSAESAALQTALRAAATVVARPDDQSTRAALAHALHASQQALILATGAAPPVDVDFVSRVGGAVNACLRALDRVLEVDKIADPDTLLEGEPFAATRDRPSLSTPRRERFTRPASVAPFVEEDAEPDADEEAESEAGDAEEAESVELEIEPEEPEDALMQTTVPSITVDRKVGLPVSISAYYADITATCLETAAMLARERSTFPLSQRGESEARILELADTAAITGRDTVARTLDAWAESLDSPDPWKSWAAAFFLGTLAGADALSAVVTGLERLPVDAIDRGLMAAEALSVSPHPALGALARDLSLSPHPIARAVGVDLSARLSLLGLEDLQRHLADANIPVLAAACRAAADVDRKEAPAIVPILQRWLYFPHRDVAWPAARALLLHGHREPYGAVKAGDRLVRVLGPLAAEILVLAGDPSDMPRLQTILGRSPPGPQQMSALARFGHPAAWAYLLRQLDNPDRAEPASLALRTLFGAISADEDEEPTKAAWQSAIVKMPIEPGVRYRSGEPWSPRVVAEECQSGHLSRVEIERRVDELAVRAGVRTRVDLRLFIPDFDPALRQWRAEAIKSSASLRAGTW